MKQKTEHQKGTVENIYQLNGTVPIVRACVHSKKVV